MSTSQPLHSPIRIIGEGGIILTDKIPLWKIRDALSRGNLRYLDPHTVCSKDLSNESIADYPRFKSPPW